MEELTEFIDKMLKNVTDPIEQMQLTNIRKHIGPPCKRCGSNLSHSQICVLLILASKYGALN